MIVQFSIVPLGRGTSVSRRVAEALRIVESSGLDYRLTPMGTVVEGSWDDVMALVRQCHRAVLKHEKRVLTTITIDDRKGAKNRIEMKVKSVEKKAGKKLRT